MDARVLLFVLEYQLLRQILSLYGVPLKMGPKNTPAQESLIRDRLQALVPFVPVREPLPAWKRARLHVQGFWAAVKDAPSVQKRRLAQQDDDLSEKLRDAFRDFPAYYKRNYHHQTDGYLSLASAQRYDHQLELVFFGMGQKIRRVGASQLRRFLAEDGEYKMLECGAGTGELSAIMLALFPKADVLATDPSPFYIQWAKAKYPNLRVRTGSTFMEDMSFCESSTFDVVCSSYVWHEIPAVEARKALDEVSRVLKKGGYLFLIDSAQDHDGSENAFAFERFETDFYEPYYPEYRAGCIEEQIEGLGFEVVHKQMLLFGKVVIAQKKRD